MHVPEFSKPVRIPDEVECSITEPPTATAGKASTWLLPFRLSRDVAEGESLFVLFHGGRNVKGAWSALQPERPEDAGFFRVLGPDGSAVDSALMEDAGTARFKAPAGGLRTGDVLTVELGGAAGAVAPQLAVMNKMFLLYVEGEPDPLVPKENPERSKEVIAACLIHVVGGQTASLRVLAPSRCVVGENVSVLVRPEDEFGNVASEPPGELEISLDQDRVGNATVSPVPDSSCALVGGIKLTAPGVYRLRVNAPELGLSAVSNPIECLEDASSRGSALLWGMIHGHTELSDGQGRIDDYFRYMRDECLLDFGAPGDHDHLFETTDQMWKMVQESVARFNAPGRFVTFLGYEWAKWRRNGDGDRNVYYLQDHRPMYRSDNGEYPNPPALFEAVKNEQAVVIPHHSANLGNHCDWKDHDPEKERLVEIYSVWGNSERGYKQGNPFPIRPNRGRTGEIDCAEAPDGFVQRALEMGWRVGFTGGGDDHQGHPGDDMFHGSPPYRYKAGLMAVLADEKTRESIWEALWQRRCYATTCARIILEFGLNGEPMGSELDLETDPELRDRRRIEVVAHGTAPISKIEIVRNNEDVFAKEGEEADVSAEWVDDRPFDEVALPPAKYCSTPFCFYYVRLTQADGEMAWASPVWVLAQQSGRVPS